MSTAASRSEASPAIVAYVDHGTTNEGLDYLVTEWLEGKTLADVLEADASLTLGEALTLGVDLARALAHLHAQGILHRDVKPANVFLVGASLGDEGRDDMRLGDMKLLDFGLSRPIDGDGTGTATGPSPGTSCPRLCAAPSTSSAATGPRGGTGLRNRRGNRGDRRG